MSKAILTTPAGDTTILIVNETVINWLFKNYGALGYNQIEIERSK